MSYPENSADLISSGAALPLVSEGDIGGSLVATVNARDLHAYLDVGKDFSTWIKDRTEQYDFVENLDFVCSPISGSNGRGGHNRKDYFLTLDTAKELSMVERNAQGKRARLHFIECERRAKATAPTVPDFADPAAAARAWADQFEARMLAERTKAEIGTRREATAMNTASQAVKTANGLRIQLDQSKEYATIKRMSLIYHGQSFEWRILKHVSADLGIAPRDVFDANYGTVKAYHADVWREAYALEIDTAHSTSSRREAEPPDITA